jgi:hypothetical protein
MHPLECPFVATPALMIRLPVKSRRAPSSRVGGGVSESKVPRGDPIVRRPPREAWRFQLWAGLAASPGSIVPFSERLTDESASGFQRKPLSVSNRPTARLCS